MNTKKVYDLPFFSEKLKKIAGQVRDPVIHRSCCSSRSLLSSYQRTRAERAPARSFKDCLEESRLTGGTPTKRILLLSPRLTGSEH